MTASHPLFLSSTAFLLSACASASGTFLPLGPDHPASPQAAEIPIQDPSAFLRVEAGDNSSAPEPTAPSTEEPSAASPRAYTCPMHAEVTSDQPGRCPQCGMKLEPREKTGEEQEEHPHDG